MTIPFRELLSKRPVRVAAGCAGLALLLLFAFLLRNATHDVFARFAPMAEAFAEGNWQEAFHPRFGVGFQILTGSLVFLSGGLLSGWDACLIVAVVGFYLSFFPLFRICSRVFDRTTAWFGVILLAVCPQILRLVLYGFRESFRMLGVLLLVEAVLTVRDEKDGCRTLIPAAFGAIILCTFRVDSVVPGCLLVLLYGILARFRAKAWILFGVTLLALQPVCFLVWRWTGTWLPGLPFVGIFQKIVG